MNVVAVVAGNYREFIHFMGKVQAKRGPLFWESRVGNKSFFYVTDMQKLQSIRDCEFVFTGTFEKRKDIEEIKEREKLGRVRR